MKRYIFFFLFVIFGIGCSFSQNGERRIYYLDCSYSMVKPNNIWEDVRDNLIAAIDAVEDETTELYVIPFAVDGSIDCCWDCYYEKATSLGKSNLRKKIEGIIPSKKSMTYHSVTIKDFYNNNRVANDKITYMFLMTDGDNEEKNSFGCDFFLPELVKWKDKYGLKDVYGFYVMLHKSAKEYAEVEKIINQPNDHLWKVETADVNINLIRLENGCIYNVRNDSYVDIPIYGKTENIELKLNIINNNSNYCIKKQEQTKDYIRLYIEPQGDVSFLPQNELVKLSIKSNGIGDFDFIVAEEITLICENKKVKEFSPTFNKGKKIEKLGKVTYYPAFGWCKAKTDTLIETLFLGFNKDAKGSGDAYAVFKFTDTEGKTISSLHIFKDSQELKDNKLRVNCDEDSVILKFVFDSSADAKKYQGYLKIMDHNLDRVSDPLKWQIYYEKDMNPLMLGLLWFVILFVSCVLLWMLVFKPIFYPRFGAIQKTINVPGMAPLIIKFKGAREVVVAASHPKKQSAWNRIWTGKIIYKTHPAFVTPITFKPSRGRRILVKVPAGAYQVLPNPMPGVGSATIIDIHKNLKINVN